ncbi:MAG: tetratricopeptide repeat protein [Ignavibacteriaceae bacterium]|nr:tetratricopeptide repeat protein [Ignavibacteriaceae bacterium]
MKKLTTIFCVMFFVALSFTTNAQTAAEFISQGDQLAMKEFKNQEALNKYLEADKLSPNNWEIMWRISRAYVDISEHLPSGTSAQKDEQLRLYQLAFDYANKAVSLAPDKSITYLRRAIANGRIALFKGVFSVIGIVGDVKNDCEKAISLGNGGNEIQASAHYVLGRTHAKVCEKPYLVRLPLGLGWGDMDVAITEFNKAIKLRPNFRMFRLDLAKAYIEEDEYAKAREQLNAIPGLPVLDEDDYSIANEAKQLLEQIKNKK